TYVFGVPESSRKSFAAPVTPVRNAAPENFWQSVQWQTAAVAGSTSASYRMAPQWQPPVTFMIAPSIDEMIEILRQAVADAITPAPFRHALGDARDLAVAAVA